MNSCSQHSILTQYFSIDKHNKLFFLCIARGCGKFMYSKSMHGCIPQKWHNPPPLSNYFARTMIWDALILISHTRDACELGRCAFFSFRIAIKSISMATYRTFNDPKQLLLLFWSCYYTSHACVCMWPFHAVQTSL